jgi:hypothetical protein
MWKKTVVVCLKYYPRTCLGDLTKIAKKTCQNFFSEETNKCTYELYTATHISAFVGFFIQLALMHGMEHVKYTSEYLVSRPNSEQGTCTTKMRRLSVSDNLLDRVLIENP